MGKILVVDDDQSTLDMISLMLEKEGFQVLTAINGRIALEMAREHRPSLVLLDIMMPELHGFSVCHQIKNTEALKDTKIVMISSKSFPADRHQAKEAGADGYLAKPITHKELIQAVRTYLS